MSNKEENLPEIDLTKSIYMDVLNMFKNNKEKADEKILEFRKDLKKVFSNEKFKF